jgi:hypothetical protein
MKWFKRFREAHEDCEDVQATAAIMCPKSRMWCKISLITGSHRPFNRRIINCTLTRRQLGILEKENLCCPYWEMNARSSKHCHSLSIIITKHMG